MNMIKMTMTMMTTTTTMMLMDKPATALTNTTGIRYPHDPTVGVNSPNFW